MYPLPEKPKISIVVPALNEEKLIERTLKNAREVIPGAELIVVDGGSKDGTVEIARKYAKVIVERGNIASARNTGARASEGDILVFLDADTSINERFVDEALKVLRNPEIVGAGGLIMPNRSNLLSEVVFYSLNLIILISFLFGRRVLAGTCVAYKKKPFFDVGGFDVKRVASEDFDLCERISKKGKILFLKVIIRTSRRRLEKLGLLGLILDWARVTLRYIQGKKIEGYRAFR